MPSTVAALIRGEIRGKNIGLAIGRVPGANKRFGKIQIVISAAERRRSFELPSVQPRREL
jgi:hypothetical protein